MITPDYACTMATYNAELNRRVFGAARRIPDDVYRTDDGVFWKSIHGTLCHVLWADQAWMSRFGVGELPQVGIKDSDKIADDFDDLWCRRQKLDEVILHWTHALTPVDLEGDVVWFSMAVDQEEIRSKALAVMHMFNHQTHHRGQAHALITRAGETTGDTDLTLVLPV